MAEYASASLISGQSGYPMRPPSIHGGTGGLIFTPQPTAYPTAQSPTGQDVFLQPTAMLVGTSTASNAVNGNGVFPLIVSCSSGFGDTAVPSLSMLPSHSKNGLFDTLKSIDTLPPHEEMRWKAGRCNVCSCIPLEFFVLSPSPHSLHFRIHKPQFTRVPELLPMMMMPWVEHTCQTIRHLPS